MFRLYAKTSKGNDKYLFEELRKFGLSPKYEDQLHAFYFNATFRDLFCLSFRSLGIESLYVQLGHRFPSGAEHNIQEGLTKLPFRNYLPIQRGLVESLTLSIMIRQSA